MADLLAPMDSGAFERLDKRKTVPAQVPPYGQGKVVNRYWDILPCPRTRVKLKCLNGDQATQYINANFVRGYGPNASPREYIAAQGPLSATLNAFVRMIFEQQCTAVVMTTKLVEKDKVKCERYWPSKPGFAQRYGDITVGLLRVKSEGAYERSTLSLTRGQVTREVEHFWCVALACLDGPCAVSCVSCTVGTGPPRPTASPQP